MALMVTDWQVDRLLSLDSGHHHPRRRPKRQLVRAYKADATCIRSWTRATWTYSSAFRANPRRRTGPRSPWRHASRLGSGGGRRPGSTGSGAFGSPLCLQESPFRPEPRALGGDRTRAAGTDLPQHAQALRHPEAFLFDQSPVRQAPLGLRARVGRPAQTRIPLRHSRRRPVCDIYQQTCLLRTHSHRLPLLPVSLPKSPNGFAQG